MDSFFASARNRELAERMIRNGSIEGSAARALLGGDVRITDSVRLYARVENLTDARYEEVYTYVAPGRAFYAGLKAGF